MKTIIMMIHARAGWLTCCCRRGMRLSKWLTGCVGCGACAPINGEDDGDGSLWTAVAAVCALHKFRSRSRGELGQQAAIRVSSTCYSATAQRHDARAPARHGCNQAGAAEFPTNYDQQGTQTPPRPQSPRAVLATCAHEQTPAPYQATQTCQLCKPRQQEPRADDSTFCYVRLRSSGPRRTIWWHPTKMRLHVSVVL